VAFLRLGSTRRVVGLLVGAAAVLVLLAAVASAALGGGGAPPPAKPLDQAIHDSLTGPKLDGVTAHVDFTSHLFDGATTDTSSALLKGGSGRLWAAPGKLRLELQSDNGDAQIVVADGKGFVYDGPSGTAYTFAAGGGDTQRHQASDGAVPTLAQIQKKIANAEQHVSIAGPQPEVVGGQPAYQVRVTPHSQGGLLGAAELAWDAARGVPLKVALYARGAGSPAVELSVTDIAYGAVDPSVFDISPPPDAHVVDLGGGQRGAGGGDGTSGQSTPSFAAVAPSALGPRDRRRTKQAGDGYVVLYGKQLDTIAVFEHAAKASGKQPAPSGEQGDQQPLQLPTTSINGAKATEFGTPLGGIVSFERDGVSYTVVGSQPLSVLEAAARAL
jgi:outer membrane lipoprotein-sorting protein